MCQNNSSNCFQYRYKWIGPKDEYDVMKCRTIHFFRFTVQYNTGAASRTLLEGYSTESVRYYFIMVQYVFVWFLICYH